jgi:peptide-methionine (S)-S-oxide reductase
MPFMARRVVLALVCLAALLGTPARAAETGGASAMDPRNTAIFAGGCFWCLESALKGQPGVVDTEAGYAGGHTQAPTYDQISTGRTGHAEVVRVTFDPAATSYAALADAFLTKAHDPTQKNRQGVDVGPQYRSALFPLDSAQETQAHAAIERARAAWPRPVVTTVEAAPAFWPAETHHQDYYAKWEATHGRPHPRAAAKSGR